MSAAQGNTSDQTDAQQHASRVLRAEDPAPVAWVNRDSNADVLLLCEHAGNELPEGYELLGLSDDQINSHIGWDIGAAAVARELATVLQVPLILQRYSRLLIDCNRPPAAPDSIPERSDGISIPANLELSAADKQARRHEIFEPLDRAINEGLVRFQRKAVFSIHSFTPQMHDQQVRPWHAGFLTRTDHDTGNALIRHIKRRKPELTLALNEPYSIDDESDWFIPRYAESQGLTHCLIEIRNDQLLSNDGVSEWASLLASAVNSLMKDTA